MRREVTVRELKREDTEAVSGAMARAFEHDPVYEWFLPNEKTRLRKMVTINEALLPRLLPVDFMELHTTDDCAGVSIWVGPEEWEPPTKAMLTALPKLLVTMGLSGTMKMINGMGLMKKHHPTEPHWYLMGLGTDPPKQGIGVGTALVNRGLERCDSHQLGAYLETQKAKNVPYYEKFGFRVTGEIDLPRGGPHLWLMWRDPQ